MRNCGAHRLNLKGSEGSEVGELGDTLSGGEKQRIGLARSFLHDAPFMLLDEPTSNLDSLNEAVILRSLKKESEGKTVVLVSHRASTMRIADENYSVENGRLS
jgi:ATP-binding cassette subfamily C protein